MSVKVTMVSGAQFVAHEARTDGVVNGEHVSVYVVREATTGGVVGEVRREARPSMSGPGADYVWVAQTVAHDTLWRAVRTVAGGKIASVETTTDDATAPTGPVILPSGSTIDRSTYDSIVSSDAGWREWLDARMYTGADAEWLDENTGADDDDDATAPTGPVAAVLPSGQAIGWAGQNVDDAPATLRTRLVDNGRTVHVWWVPGTGVMPTRQRAAAAARAESGGHPIRYRQTFVESGRVTVAYSREVNR